MRCVICGSQDIEHKEVEEEIKVGNDIVIVPAKVMVCMNCGERYYDRETMKMLEEVEDKIEKKQLKFELMGKVLKVAGGDVKIKA
ncbi:MAG: YgiT-type zinc finger protein [Halobacteriota archaeon]